MHEKPEKPFAACIIHRVAHIFDVLGRNAGSLYIFRLFYGKAGVTSEGQFRPRTPPFYVSYFGARATFAFFMALALPLHFIASHYTRKLCAEIDNIRRQNFQ